MASYNDKWLSYSMNVIMKFNFKQKRRKRRNCEAISRVEGSI
jgi:hypothetical protein